MKKLAVLLAIVVLAWSAQDAQAQDDYYNDVLEIAFHGGVGIPSGGISDWQDSLGAKTGFAVGADIGYFLKPNMTLGFNFMYTDLGHEEIAGLTDAGFSNRLYNPNIYLKYMFQGDSDWEPYFKLHAGLEFPRFVTFVSHSEGDRWRELSYGPVFAGGIGVGLFRFTSDWGGFFLEANYHYAFTDGVTAEYGDDEYEFDESTATIDLHAGIRILIGADE